MGFNSGFKGLRPANRERFVTVVYGIAVRFLKEQAYHDTISYPCGRRYNSYNWCSR